MKTKLLNYLRRYRGFIIALAIVTFGGYTAYQIKQLTTVQPDQTYIEAEKDKARKNSIRFDQPTIDGVKNLVNVTAKPDLSNLGKPDPFSP